LQKIKRQIQLFPFISRQLRLMDLGQSFPAQLARHACAKSAADVLAIKVYGAREDFVRVSEDGAGHIGESYR
jgi:hypothetical protein